jgi:pleckstrin family protein M 2
LEKEGDDRRLTNSDYQVHELVQQFDNIFLLGLKKPEEGYCRLVFEFTHRNVISELTRLLNVTTSFGRGRAWLYHALNDNLMESYLKCLLENKKPASKFYRREAALVTDEQAVTVLVTLVAGLENVEFKLQNDVPYLDHSCWPPHLNLKRHIVDAILNSSPQTLVIIRKNN